MKLPKLLSVNQRWIIAFGLWLLLLSGVFANFLGSPGILQAARLDNLLSLKVKQLQFAKTDLKKLHNEVSQLETSRVVQEKEIRRVLGYAASDELIFDFSEFEMKNQ